MRLFTGMTTLWLVAAAIGCQANHPIASTDSNTPDSTPSVATADHALTPPNTAVLWVRGLACPQCAYNVDLQLLKVPGVESVKVDMSMGKVTAALSPTSPPTREQLAAAIKQTTFTLVRIDM